MFSMWLCGGKIPLLVLAKPRFLIEIISAKTRNSQKIAEATHILSLRDNLGDLDKYLIINILGYDHYI
jgi:hypothetical protein